MPGLTIGEPPPHIEVRRDQCPGWVWQWLRGRVRVYDDRAVIRLIDGSELHGEFKRRMQHSPPYATRCSRCCGHKLPDAESFKKVPFWNETSPKL